MVSNRVIVCGYKFVCAERRSDAHLLPTGDANIKTDIAVAVAILD